MGRKRRKKRSNAPAAVETAASSPQGPQGLSANALAVFLALGLLIGLVFGNALQNQFVFDDYELVVENRQIRSLDNIPAILGFDDAPRRYRPVRFISYSLDHFLFGPEAWGYRLSNLVYHWLTAFLVYLIARRLLGNATTALLAAVLFAVHPVQTDAVTYISGRRDVLSALFYLLGFYAFLRYRADGRAWYLLVVFVAFVLGVLTKEMVVTLPLMLLLYDWCRRFPTDHPRVDLAFLRAIPATLWSVLRRHAALYGPIFLLAGLFLIEKLVLHNPSRMEGLYGDTYLLHFLTVARIFAYYIVLLCFPLILNADYSYNTFPVTDSPLDPWAWGAVLLLAVIAAGLLKALQKKKIVAFAGLWFFVTLLPVSQLVPHHEMMAEHYLYLPSVGFCLLAALGIEGMSRSQRVRPYAYGGFLVVLALLSLRTVARNLEWRDNITLWRATVETAPRNSRAHDNLATAYARQGEIDKAIAHYREALAIWPRNLQAHNHLGNAYYQKGRLDEARLAYQRAVELKPDYAPTYFNLGRVLGRQGRIDEALEAFRLAVRHQPRYARAHHELATAYYKKGLPERAREHYLKALEIDPAYLSAYRNLGVIYQEQGGLDDAISAYRALLAIDPGHVEAHLSLARLYLRRGQEEQALNHLRHVLALAPGHPDAPRVRRLVENLTEDSARAN